ncbi:MAG: hypothetical protein M1840_007360 [Geoglossum simile]|nr:MAG: hypothetical protein M1840_007360 [Geoglossum simile]
MDGLSAAASVIAVINISGQVFDLCRKYYLEVKDARKDIQRLRDDVTSLQDVLTNVAELADAPGSAKLSILGLLNQPDGPVERCRTELEGLAAKLKPGQGNDMMKQFGMRALKWPFSSKDVDKAIEAIGRYQAIFSLALTADQTTLVLAIQNTALGIQKDVARLNLLLVSTRIGTHHPLPLLGEASLSGVTDGQREKIHRWLSAPDPSLNHNEAHRKRQATTGTWLVESRRFVDWKATQDSFLWLHGIPGCGKTVLASTIIENVLHHCHLDPALAVAYFYFDFNDIEKQRHENMIRSLIAQLSIQSASIPQALESLFSSCMNGARQPVTDALLETLRQMIREFTEVFIILDALDECKERQELLEDIGKIAEWKAGKLHILATSRREKDIEEQIEPQANQEENICIQSALVNDDIRAYIHERLQTDRKLRRWQSRPEVQQEIEGTLMDKADGMFRWAVCQLDALGACLNRPMLRKALASLPKTLDDTYARILGSIDEEHSRSALEILQWLVYSTRPLQLKEIAEVIAVNIEGNPRFDPERRFPDPRDILIICPSLVTIAEEVAIGGSNGEIRGLVRLAHFSVKEYLVSERIQTGPASWYSIQEIPANISIAESCLAYLLQFNRPDSLTSQTTEDYPLARYASRHWTRHARWAWEDATTVHTLIMELFLSERYAYINWIRLYDPDAPWSPPDITRSSYSIASPLYYASLADLLESAGQLLEAGADVNAQEGFYGNALQAASFSGLYQAVQQLLEAGADVNAQGGFLGNALQAASAKGQDRVVQRLLEAGADVNAQGGHFGTALRAASVRSHDQIAQRLLEAGANANMNVKSADSNEWNEVYGEVRAYLENNPQMAQQIRLLIQSL